MPLSSIVMSKMLFVKVTRGKRTSGVGACYSAVVVEAALWCIWSCYLGSIEDGESGFYGAKKEVSLESL